MRGNAVVSVVLVLLAVGGPAADRWAGHGPAEVALKLPGSVVAAPAYQLPLAGAATVLTPFRPPPQPWAAGHRGVDLAAAVAEPVLAAGAGVVVYAGRLAGRGVVSVEHAGGLRTTYEPVTAAVSRGSQVEAGELLGVLEAGHASCAPWSCLHWGARMGETYVDPMLLLGPLQVRLLPWDG